MTDTAFRPRIALVEDDPLMGESLVQSLALEGMTVQWLRTGADAIAALGTGTADAVICDLRLPDMSGEEVFSRLSDRAGHLPFLFMTAYGDLDQAVRLIRGGGGDYVTKPFDMAEFLARLNDLLLPTRAASDGVLGISAAMREIELFLGRIATVPGPLLITGETGVGKEVAARHLHRLACPDRPFMAVNCAAIPPDLLENEIFGHERGAFTGAHARHQGYAERAGRGILFLDEIGEMPASLQVKLLRLIDDRQFHRVGGSAPVPLEARIVAATNADLKEEVAHRRFREDLLYRLDTFEVELPPLRDRPDDIPWLIERLFDPLNDRRDSPLRGISPLAVEAARRHGWPGNVRELRNRMERAVALALGSWLMPADLFPQASAAAPGGGATSLAAVREQAERHAIACALAETDGHVQQAARRLAISRTTLWEKMRRLGLSGD